VNTEILRVLKAFSTAMHAWETACAERDGEDEARTESALAVIFAQHCTKPPAKHRAGTYQIPPAYDKGETGEVELINAKRAQVTVQSKTGMKFQYRYVVVEKAGAWRIDSKHRFSSLENKG
jgi:hypothetical protein